MLSSLEQCELIFIDGTFSVIPHGTVTQLWTVHGIMRGFNILGAAFILPSKERPIYRRALQALRNSIPGLNPTAAMMDLETSESQAVLDVWPDISIRRCFFHMRQAVHRNIQEKGLTKLYADSEEFCKLVGCLPAFAFVPRGDVVQCWDQWVDELTDREIDDLGPMLEYFAGTYVGLLVGRRRRRPLYIPEEWNAREAALTGSHKTNNIVERWNSAFTRMVGKSRSFWGLLEGLQKEAGLARLDYAEIQRGQDPKRRKNVVVQNSPPPPKSLRPLRPHGPPRLPQGRLPGHSPPIGPSPAQPFSPSPSPVPSPFLSHLLLFLSFIIVSFIYFSVYIFLYLFLPSFIYFSVMIVIVEKVNLYLEWETWDQIFGMGNLGPKNGTSWHPGTAAHSFSSPDRSLPDYSFASWTSECTVNWRS